MINLDGSIIPHEDGATSTPLDDVGGISSNIASISPIKSVFRPPSYVMITDIMRGLDAFVIIGAACFERLPIVQSSLTNTVDHNQLLSNIIGGVVAFGVLGSGDGHKIRKLKSFRKQLTRLVGATAAGTASVFSSMLVLHSGSTELLTGPLRWLEITGGALFVTHIATTSLIRHWVSKGLLAKKVALVGCNSLSAKFIQNAQKHADTYRVVAIYDNIIDDSVGIPSHIKIRNDIENLFPDSQHHEYDSVIITKDFQNEDEFTHILDLIKSSVADIQVAGNFISFIQTKQDLQEEGGNLVTTVFKKPLKDWQIFYKSAFDRLIGCAALVVLSPILIATAVAIKIDSKGPVFFLQPRVGFNNLLFGTYKFRSMYTEKSDYNADVQTQENDPRITRIGKFLRKYSIDELPQLINVIKGDMSLVGPRPHAPGTKADGFLFHEVVSDYALRHRVKPGITGWAQVNGLRGQTKTVESIRRRVEFDLYYIKHWSLFFDLKILVLTVLREIKSKTAF